MNELQRDLGRVARQLDRAADRIKRHGSAKGSAASRHEHHLGFDMVGAIKPRANNPSPAIASMAMWYAADAVMPLGPRSAIGMAYSPRRLLEWFCDSHWVTGEIMIERLRQAAYIARLDQAVAA